MKFSGFSYFNNSFDEIMHLFEFYNNHFFNSVNKSKSFNILPFNNITLHFYKGKNLTSNKEMLIMEEKGLISNTFNFLFSNIEDLIIEIDKKNFIFKLKILQEILYDGIDNNNKKDIALIQMILKLMPIKINNQNQLKSINIYSFEDHHCYMMIKPEFSKAILYK